MKVSLRKASAFQNSITEAIRGISIKSMVKVNEFTDPESVIAVERETLLKNVERKNKLLGALYSIRKDVGLANNTAGVDERLAQVALIEKRIQLYTDLANNQVRTEPAVLAGKLEKIRARPTDARSVYGYSDEVETTVVTEADVQGFRERVVSLKKEKQKIQDEILELNVRTEIELNEIVVVSVLQAEGLL